jgi:hypothetical protein
VHAEPGQGIELPRRRALILERQVRQGEVEAGLGMIRRGEDCPSE